MAIWRYLVIIFLFLYLFSGTAVAQQCGTNLELTELIKGISLSSGIYSDVENIKSLALLFLYTKEGGIRNENYCKFAESVKKFLEEFNTIFQKSTGMQPNDHKEGLKNRTNLKNEIFYLESLSKSSKELESSTVTEIVNKEKSSLNRFLKEQAIYFEDIAKKEEAVPLKIEYLDYASMAYQESKNPRYELIKKNLEDKKSSFNIDMEQALNFSEKADVMMSTLEKDDKGLFNLFPSYIKSKDAIKNYLNAIEIYNNNGISDKTLQRLPENYAKDYKELVTKISYAEEISSSIFNNLITSFLKILTPMFLIFIIFMLGFKEWKKDFVDMKLNRVVRRD